eukprot:m.239517 g.239517  ORF g.239517 m.239517 type:complete len:458 (+) comp10919_c1_seq1:944-2317(+)
MCLLNTSTPMLPTQTLPFRSHTKPSSVSRSTTSKIYMRTSKCTSRWRRKTKTTGRICSLSARMKLSRPSVTSSWRIRVHRLRTAVLSTQASTKPSRMTSTTSSAASRQRSSQPCSPRLSAALHRARSWTLVTGRRSSASSEPTLPRHDSASAIRSISRSSCKPCARSVATGRLTTSSMPTARLLFLLRARRKKTKPLSARRCADAAPSQCLWKRLTRNLTWSTLQTTQTSSRGRGAPSYRTSRKGCPSQIGCSTQSSSAEWATTRSSSPLRLPLTNPQWLGRTSTAHESPASSTVCTPALSGTSTTRRTTTATTHRPKLSRATSLTSSTPTSSTSQRHPRTRLRPFLMSLVSASSAFMPARLTRTLRSRLCTASGSMAATLAFATNSITTFYSCGFAFAARSTEDRRRKSPLVAPLQVAMLRFTYKKFWTPSSSAESHELHGCCSQERGRDGSGGSS